MGFSSCVVGLVSLQHVESSWTRVQTVSPTLAGGFLTTGPPGVSQSLYFSIPQVKNNALDHLPQSKIQMPIQTLV